MYEKLIAFLCYDRIQYSQPHHEEDNDGRNQHPGGTGIVVAEVEVQLATLTGRLHGEETIKARVEYTIDTIVG